MRGKTRIRPILQLIEEIWAKNQDLRLGQLLENAGIDFNTEDVNWVVEKLTSHYNLKLEDYALWGVLVSPSERHQSESGEKVSYQRLCTLTSPHLENILKEIPQLSTTAACIIKILNRRSPQENSGPVDWRIFKDSYFKSLNTYPNCAVEDYPIRRIIDNPPQWARLNVANIASSLPAPYNLYF